MTNRNKVMLCCYIMRTQIQLSDEQHSRVRDKAASLGITMAEYIRRLVDRDLGEETPSADPSHIFALGHSGGSDIAAGKTAAVIEAIRSERGLAE